jgi:subtilisin family serine protease
LANGTYIEKPDIVAPGVEICAARYKDAYLEYGVPWCLDEQHMSISGTSMSTPHVAGVAALLLQTHPDWKPEDIKNAMKATAINLGFDVNTQVLDL